MRHKKFSRFIIIAAAVALAVYLVSAVYSTATDVIGETCDSEINAEINNIINESNDTIMALGVFYSDYFTIVSDDDGNLTAIKANTGLINQITLIWNTEIQNKLNELREYKIEMPLGALTGHAVISSYGRNITVTARTVSNCSITFGSQFISQGINQTLHRFIMHVEITADVTVPSRAADVTVTQDTVLAETIIAGKVPSTYLIDSGGNSDYLDLLP